MDLRALTFESVERLKAQLESKGLELQSLEAASPEDLWERDLDALSVALDRLDAEDASRAAAAAPRTGGRMARGSKRPVATSSTPGDRCSVQEESRPSEGSLRSGQVVEYWSRSAGRWVTAKVLATCEDGHYDLDVKRRAAVQNIRTPGLGCSGPGPPPPCQAPTQQPDQKPAPQQQPIVRDHQQRAEQQLHETLQSSDAQLNPPPQPSGKLAA